MSRNLHIFDGYSGIKLDLDTLGVQAGDLFLFLKSRAPNETNLFRITTSSAGELFIEPVGYIPNTTPYAKRIKNNKGAEGYLKVTQSIEQLKDIKNKARPHIYPERKETIDEEIYRAYQEQMLKRNFEDASYSMFAQRYREERKKTKSPDSVSKVDASEDTSSTTSSEDDAARPPKPYK